MAEIGWIDFSRKDRNRVNTILELLKPEGQVDELGIGTMRDALADQLFPGISTIQTRAKYFLIIPYILWDFLKLNPSDRKKKLPTKFLEEMEYEVMWDLGDYYKHEEGHGVVGISKRREYSETVARRPSEIYWAGLNKLKCINTKGLSANAFLNRANRNNLETLVHAVTEEGHSDDNDAGFENYFNLNVSYQENWREGLNLNLTYTEASFLKDSMIDLKNSVLALIVADTNAWNLFFTSVSFVDFARQCIDLKISPVLKTNLILAHDFAILVEGAHIAYNQELQLKFLGTDCFQDEWQEWYQSRYNKMLNLNDFDTQKLFEYAYTTRPRTRNFIEEWVKLLKSEELDTELKRKLICEQEYNAKGKKSRIKFNRKDDVKEGEPLGLSRLEFRFGNARIIVNDVIEGLKDA